MIESKYAQDGVNVPLGDKFSAYSGKMCERTYKNSPYVVVKQFSDGHFRGPRGFNIYNLPSYWMTKACDGVGTKSILVDTARTHHQAARDLLAMCCGDVTRWGGLPLVFTNILDVKTLGQDESSDTYQGFCQLIIGLEDAAREQKLVVLSGETAELGDCVSSENPNATTQFNWGGDVLGVYAENKMITGKNLKPQQAVVALREYGFRSNGISSVRKAFKIRDGEKWYEYNYNEVEPTVIAAYEAAAAPSVLYDRFLATANGWYNEEEEFKSLVKMEFIAHVTGGSIESKFFGDILKPRGLSVELFDLWEPPRIMEEFAKIRGLSDRECYSTWNCGQGALVVMEHDQIEEFVSLAKDFGIEAQVCGIIRNTKSDGRPQARIVSKFTGEQIVFE